MNNNFKKIIVCATQRCGSTMICEDLLNSGFGRPNEWFNSWPHTMARDWQAEFKTIKEKGTANGIFAVKIMANQLAPVNARAASFIEDADPPPFAHFRNLIGCALWLWSRRSDVIDQAISRVVARQRGIYHSVKKRNSGFVPGRSAIAGQELPEPTYDFEEIRQEVDLIRRENEMWRTFFTNHEIKPLTVWYEDAIRESVAHVVAASLGIKATTTGSRNLVKLPPNDTLKRQFLSDLGT